MVRLWNKFAMCHALLEPKRQVEPYSIILATDKAPMFLIVAQYGISSVEKGLSTG
jgi:hypothetical protein